MVLTVHGVRITPFPVEELQGIAIDELKVVSKDELKEASKDELKS